MDQQAPEIITPRQYVCYRAAGEIIVDGRLSEPSWKRAPHTDLFVDIEGNIKPRPRLGTRAMMLWDDTYLYVAAELEEPYVWGTLTQRDSIIYQDNDFEVFIDPDGDAQHYMEWEMNALNTGWDLYLNRPRERGGQDNTAWDFVGIKHAVQVDGTLNYPHDVDSGWTLEIAFPWTSMAEYAGTACPPRPGDQWRINFSRVEWQIDLTMYGHRKKPGLPEDNWVWSPQGAINMHIPEKWGYVQFSDIVVGSGEEPFYPHH